VFSAHKTLPAYSQASVIVSRTRRLDPHRLDRAFHVANSTSPAGSILASIDGARALLAAHGMELLDRVVCAVDRARDRLSDIAGLAVPAPTDFPPGRSDPTKLVLLLAGTGASGVAVEEDLLRAGIPVELADRDTVVPIVTLGDTDETVTTLVNALREAIERHRREPRPVAPFEAVVAPSATVAAMTPREAFFAPHRTVDADAAIGHVSAELVAPYPPGIPVLVPGEVIAADAVRALRFAAALGTRIAYAADPALVTLQIVDGS
jgi:arginine decarboxylase